MKNVTFIFLGLALLLMVSGCQPRPVHIATQEIPVISEPIGATVTVDGFPHGRTPTSVTLTKNRPHVIKIEKEGYKTQLFAITARRDESQLAVHAMYAGRRYYGGEASVYSYNNQTGEMNELVPQVITAVLEPETGTSTTNEPTQNEQ